MADCDDYFEPQEFNAAFQDQIIHKIRSDRNLDRSYKKWLILCWFDTVYGQWNGSRFDLKDSRAKMSNYLAKSPYTTFEELIDAN